MLKLNQIEAFLQHLLRSSIGVLEKYSDLKTGYSLKPILFYWEIEKLELNRWNRKFCMKTLNSRLVCTRDFCSCMNKLKSNLIIHKALDRICEESERYLLKYSIITECKQLLLKKLSAARPLCYPMIAFSPSYPLFFKLYPSIEKYITPSLSYHHKSIIILKCQDMLSFSRSSLCPAVQSKLFKKLPSLKIYDKCSLSLKNLNPPSSFLFKYSKFNSFKVQKNKEILTQRYPSYLVSLHRVYRREFHITSFCANSNSDKPSACKKMDEVCKSTEVKKTKQSGQSCNEKSNVYHQKKVKCDKRQLPKEKKVQAKSKPKTEREIVDPACNKTCLARGKCEWPNAVPPPKMEYIKVTCPPPKFMKPNSCPSISEHFQSDKSHIEAKKTNFQKKQICVLSPLPKPPFEPIPLCPCPPPRKMHPGPCPSYESKEVHKPIMMQPCLLKKKYPCPTDIHYCPLQKKPCNLKQDSDCEHKRKKKTPTL